jgi:SAM-dependent methyltransferase
MRDWLIMLGEEFYVAWGKMLETVRDGKDAFRHAFGKPLFEYLEANADYARTFNRGMAAGSTFFQAVPDAYDFSRFRRVVDVGGGNGAMLAAILTANPELTGVLFDAPSVVQAAKDNLEAQGLLHRCELVSGDFFQSIPEGGDVYLFSRILHDWNDESCVTILSNCRKATGSSGRALIVERLIPSPSAITSDVNMLAFTGGRERRESEFAQLLADAGFELNGITPLPLEENIIEAVPR